MKLKTFQIHTEIKINNVRKKKQIYTSQDTVSAFLSLKHNGFATNSLISVACIIKVVIRN